MSKVLNIRGLQIGAGMPKIIVPLVDKTTDGLMARARSLKGKRIDMVEWRADFFAELPDTERILYTLRGLRNTLTDMPLLFTCRSKMQGGVGDIDPAAYTALNQAVADSGLADVLDVEVFSGDGALRLHIANIQSVGALVLGSYHDFYATPPAEEILARLQQMRDMGADMVKIATMPNCTADVLALLAATAAAYEQFLDCPVISVSMSARGVISRLTGEVFGSAATFGSVGQASSPGQIPADKLAQILDILHEEV